MQLNAYETLEPNSNYWIWIPYKAMYLKDIKFRNYYAFLQVFNPTLKIYDYFIILSDVEPNIFNGKVHTTNKTKNGVLKLTLSGIWDKLPIDTRHNNVPVHITLKDKDDISELYTLDF